MANHTAFMYAGKTTLALGDTVTSSLGFYVMKLVSTGLTLTFQGTPRFLVPGVGVSSAKLTNASFVITANPSLPPIPIPLTANVLEVQDNGEVIVYDVAGDPFILFSYSPALVLVSEVALESLQDALDNVQAKARALRQTVRPVPGFPAQPDHREAPKQSGFPGSDDSADEKVA